ncbi:MAG: hypothetical protein VX899_13460 [Myxococcota bacterium]|nr:hypothetical protein [Myxococcota bacterium]
MTASLLLLLLLGAEGHRVVGEGDTVESIALELGDPALAQTLRRINGLEDDQQPAVGTILGLPKSDTPADQAAVVQSLRGQATVDRGAGPVPLPAGTLLAPGSRVCTGEASFMTLRLAVGCEGEAGDEVSLLPETCLTLENTYEADGDRSSVITMDQGSLTVQESSAGAGLVTVQTRSGLATGRGGGFRVHIEDSATRTEALASPVAVIGAGSEVGLNAGQGVRVKRGEAPGPVVELAKPGDPTLPEDQSLLRIPDFEWRVEPDALGYRLEFSADANFTDVSFYRDVTAPPWIPETFALPTQPDQGVYWRVTTIDSLGFMGLPSEPHFARFPAGVRP